VYKVEAVSQSKSSIVCVDLEHCLHWLHLEPTHYVYISTVLLPALATLGAHSLCVYFYCTTAYTGYTWSPPTRVVCFEARKAVELVIHAGVQESGEATVCEPAWYRPCPVVSEPHECATCGGWDPSAQSDDSKSEQVKHCLYCLQSTLGAHSPDRSA
jgi:hypothetical protein